MQHSGSAISGSVMDFEARKIEGNALLSVREDESLLVDHDSRTSLRKKGNADKRCHTNVVCKPQSNIDWVVIAEVRGLVDNKSSDRDGIARRLVDAINQRDRAIGRTNGGKVLHKFKELPVNGLVIGAVA